MLASILGERDYTDNLAKAQRRPLWTLRLACDSKRMKLIPVSDNIPVITIIDSV